MAEDGSAETKDDKTHVWSAFYDDERRLYYYNSVTEESSWDPPADGKFNPAPAAWVAYKDDEGREYYCNNETGETQWEAPDSYVPAPEEAYKAEEGVEEEEEPSTAHPHLPAMAELPSPRTSFEVYVSKDTFKFNAAHFVAFKGYRERLHGHNYRVGVRLLGQRKIGADGYVIDFGCIKDACKKVCKRLNEHFLCPIYSDVMQITTTAENPSVRMECEDGSIFVFPTGDCAMLPIVHATTEELSIYLWGEILHGLNADYLVRRGIHTMEVTVAEAIGQEATFRMEIPKEVGPDFKLDVRKYIEDGDVIPMPCPTEKPKESCACCCDCQGSTNFSDQLKRLADAINNGSLENQEGIITADDLRRMANRNN